MATIFSFRREGGGARDRAPRQPEPVNLADDVLRVRSGRRSCRLPNTLRPLDPLLGPDCFDCFEGSRHVDSNSLIRSLWEAPIGLFGVQRQKNGQQEQWPAGVSG
jgi:hypothetical protein